MFDLILNWFAAELLMLFFLFNPQIACAMVQVLPVQVLRY